MTAFLLAAIGSLGWKTSITFSANGLFAVELLGKQSQRRIVDSSTQTKDQVKSRFLLDIVITQSSAVLQLLSGKNQTLLIRRNSFLVLNLGLDIVDSVTWLDVQSDGLSREGLYKDLHGQS